MWERDLLGETRGAFTDALMKMRRTPLRWTRAMKTDLERIVSAAIRKMGLKADASAIVERFIEEDFVAVVDRVERERAAARRR